MDHLLRRAAALLAVAGLLAGCGDDTSTTPALASGRPPGSPATSPPAAGVPGVPTRASGADGPRLALLPPECRPGRVRLGRPTADGAGGEVFAVWTLRLVRPGPACTLLGRPRVRLLDRSGAPVAFAYRRWSRREAIRPVVVSVLRRPAFAIAASRCDVAAATYSSSIRVRLPGAGGVVLGRGRVALCAPADGLGPRTVHVGALGAWNPTSRRTPRRPQAVSMHSTFRPGGRATWGRGDVDGDGRPDVVVVAPGGRVAVDLGGRVVRAAARPGRLQALTDLDGDGGAEILVGSSAAGCCGAYQLLDSSARVLVFADGGLHLLATDRPWALTFATGRGDLFAGVVCRGDRFTQVRALLDGPRRARVVRTAYRITAAGGLIRRSVRRSVSRADPLATTASSCPGLDARGWAPHP